MHTKMYFRSIYPPQIGGAEADENDKDARMVDTPNELRMGVNRPLVILKNMYMQKNPFGYNGDEPEEDYYHDPQQPPALDAADLAAARAVRKARWANSYGSTEWDAYRAGGYASLAAVEECFARNLRASLAVLKDTYYTDVSEVGPEFPVYWPFGTHTMLGSKTPFAYETRIDLVCKGNHRDVDDPAPTYFLVEYKTRMELTQSSSKWFYLSNTDDIKQSMLAAWMFYFNTRRKVSDVFILQSTRRVAADFDDQGNDPTHPRRAGFLACHANLRLYKGPAWATRDMVRLISNFALSPYGDKAFAQYVDDMFYVPNLTRLYKAFMFTEKAVDPDTGMHPIFTEVLEGSRFTQMVREAIGQPTPQWSADRIRVGLDLHCAMPNLSDTPQDFPRMLPEFCSNATQVPASGVRLLFQKLQDGWQGVLDSIAKIGSETSRQRWSNKLKAMHKFLTRGDFELGVYVSVAQAPRQAGQSNFVPLLFQLEEIEADNGSSYYQHHPLLFVNAAKQSLEVTPRSVYLRTFTNLLLSQ